MGQCHGLNEDQACVNVFGIGTEWAVLRGRCTRVLIIPASVERIEDGCFSRCDSPKFVRFESGSRPVSLGKRALYQSSVVGISLPSSVELIDDSCFDECALLEELSIDQGSRLLRIGSKAFYGTGLRSFRVLSCVGVLGSKCFAFCRGLRELVFDDKSR